ncbi:hypothetical protein T03_12793 [Trichinella britovi]|uniref:Uncharacterized protein n=1 Tax=Trichinella britovi TaxID=45882 RepID=A0A0V1DD36_TRIBR|nr:hypothetical protein T03_12793 [Trichinella britovi]
MLPILVAQLLKDWEAHPPLPSSPKNNHRLKSLPHSSQCRPSAQTIQKTPTQRNNSRSPVVQHAQPSTNTISDSEGCYANHTRKTHGGQLSVRQCGEKNHHEREYCERTKRQ